MTPPEHMELRQRIFDRWNGGQEMPIKRLREAFGVEGPIWALQRQHPGRFEIVWVNAGQGGAGQGVDAVLWHLGEERWVIVEGKGTSQAVTELANYQNIKSMVRAAEIIYQATCPYYGFGLSSPNTFRHPGPHDRKANIDAVWDYNFLGPKLAEAFGREVLLSVPTWRTVEFDDGGFLLEMAQNPKVNWKEAVGNYESAVRILGLRTFHQGD